MNHSKVFCIFFFINVSKMSESDKQTYYQRKKKDVILKRAKGYYENDKKDQEIKEDISTETYLKKEKIKRENMGETDTMICLEKRDKK